MGPFQRRLRRAINPVSTGLTAWWCGIGPYRQVPPRAEHDVYGAAWSGPSMFFGVSSPGSWVVPPGRRPGWQWLPEYGARPNLRAMPRWARIWYRLPFVDRYAYEWMWWHGGWSVLVPTEQQPPLGGVREPRRLAPTPRPAAGMIDEASGQPIG